MGYGDSDLLFFKRDIFSVVETHKRAALDAVQRVPSNQLLNTPTEDVVDTIVHTYRLSVPELKREDAHADQREGNVTVYDSYRSRGGEPIQVTGTIVELYVPFSGDRDFFDIQPTTYDSAPPRARVEDHQLTIQHSGRGLNADQVKKSFNSALDDIERYLGWQRSTADQFNDQLAGIVRTSVENRKTKLLADQSLVAGLGFNLKPRPDAQKTYAAPVTRRKVQAYSTPPTAAPFKPEPVLDDANYKSILDIINSMTLVIERSPRAFAKMGEEDIRQQFLVQLNGQFEGAATGETFNFQGKTDILIRVEDKNIFIAECKFWTGEKGFTETIDQMLSYLSWRDTKTAVILFNRNKNFSEVLTRLKGAAKAHPHFKRGPTVEGETRFRYVFGNPSDHNREVILTVMAFDVPSA